MWASVVCAAVLGAAMASQGIVNLENAEHYTWGDGCDGWYLVKNDRLTIIQERMPPGTSETLRRHDRSGQFFYVIAGTAVMEHDGKLTPMVAGQGLEIAPGVTHKIRNASAQPHAGADRTRAGR